MEATGVRGVHGGSVALSVSFAFVCTRRCMLSLLSNIDECFDIKKKIVGVYKSKSRFFPSPPLFKARLPINSASASPHPTPPSIRHLTSASSERPPFRRRGVRSSRLHVRDRGALIGL